MNTTGKMKKVCLETFYEVYYTYVPLFFRLLDNSTSLECLIQVRTFTNFGRLVALSILKNSFHVFMCFRKFLYFPFSEV